MNAPVPHGDPIRVLVVDDDFRVAGINAEMVARVPGFVTVGTAHAAGAALEAAREFRPELVLMDIYLPDGSGLDVVRTLLSEEQPPDVVIVSAARDIESVRVAMQLGVFHYLVKPFGFEQLTERLTAYRRLHHRMASVADATDQATVDELFRLRRADEGVIEVPSKGHSAPTLELVRNAVRDADPDTSAAELADELGISRATAQRYLIYLQKHGVVSLRLKYGAAGRPEHRYHL